MEHWGVAQNCDSIVKDVQNTEELFPKKSRDLFVEYLQFTTLFNVPIKLFLEISHYFEDLKFDMVFIRNDLERCGRIIIKGGEIIDQVIITDPDAHCYDFLLTMRYMYDDNYINEDAEKIIEFVYFN